MRIGLLSDTHGLLRPQAIAFLRGCDHLIHGGDIVDASILGTLRELAPLTAVRGNNDVGPWAELLHDTESVELGGIAIYVIHDLQQIAIDPAAAGIRVVVSGHSHRPLIEERGGVLYANPGSCGPRRFTLPISAAELTIERGRVTGRIVELVAPGLR